MVMKTSMMVLPLQALSDGHQGSSRKNLLMDIFMILQILMEKAQGYPALVNHLSNAIKSSEIDNRIVGNVVSELSSAPLIETHVLATSSWHRVIHEEIDPMY